MVYEFWANFYLSRMPFMKQCYDIETLSKSEKLVYYQAKVVPFL